MDLSRSKLKKAVVSGGAGFIGSHLCQELLKRGYQVTVLDDFSTGKLENINVLERSDQMKVVCGSVTDLNLLREVFRDADYVFHLAAIASVPLSIEDPLRSHKVNVIGTINVLTASRDNSVNKMVFASSSAIYGDSHSFPKHEDQPPKPYSPYAVEKLVGEYYCLVYQKLYGLNTVCLRYFNVYGPRQNRNTQYAAVIPNFLDNISRGKPLVIYGTGKQTRDFVFVKDAAAACILAAESNVTGIFNIGGGVETSINQLAALIEELIGEDFSIEYRDIRQGEVLRSVADITRARTFGYSPAYRVSEGLRETIMSAGEIRKPLGLATSRSS